MLFRAIFSRNYSSTLHKKPHFITTPIFYVNAAPHIGHLYSAVIADSIHRFQNLINDSVSPTIFTTGTDEHGMKIQQAATKNNIPVSKYCNDISNEYRRLFDETSVSYTDYIRTTENRHRNAVTEFWKLLKSKNHIYKSKYAGWYCVPDETFLTESQLKIRDDNVKISIESGHPVEWTEEINYMFRMSNFQDDILHWIRSGDRIKPLKFEKILLDWLQEPLPDISVSRPMTRVGWGIPVPDDDSQTVYVWLDALVNYLTCAGYPLPDFKSCWPPDIQVLGKDILKFHGIYWPAFLIAADIEPPKRLLVHSHWTVDGEKMSKSKQNVVDPFDRMKTYTFEGIRYFLLREGVCHSDGNFSDVKLMRILNSELADTLGNLLSRCCAKSLNPLGKSPIINPHSLVSLKKLDITNRLLENVETLSERTYSSYQSYNFHLVVDNVIHALHLCNNFVETTKPWTLKNGNIEQTDQLKTIIGITLEVLRVSGIILQPIVPQLTKQLLDKLNVNPGHRMWKDLKNFRWNQMEHCEKDLGTQDPVLFRRIKLDEPQNNVPNNVKSKIRNK